MRKMLVKFYTSREEIVQIYGLMHKKPLLKMANSEECTFATKKADSKVGRTAGKG